MEVIVKSSPKIEIELASKVVRVESDNIDIDSALSTESENPVQNKVITAELSSLGDSLSSLEDSKADKEGVYSGMTVGRSIDLLGVDDVEEGSFLFRPTDGDGSIKDGVAVVKSVKGDSVVWNQWVKPFQEADIKPNLSDITFHGNDTTIVNWGEYKPFRFNVQLSKNIRHKYLLQLDYANTNANQNIILQFGGGTASQYSTGHCVVFYTNSTVATGAYVDYLSLYLNSTMEGSITLSNLNLYDLTQMFGAGNEPSTIEEFNARVATLCIEDMNAYNAGEVVNMKASGIKSVGFNAWDEEWEGGRFNTDTGEPNPASGIRTKNSIKVLPNAEYYCNYDNAPIFGLFYDAEGQLIQGVDRGNNFINIRKRKFATPANAASMIFYVVDITTYNHDICINLVHSGYRNGEYEPYVEDVLALPTLDLFPNGMNKIGDVYDEYDEEKSVQRIGIRPYQSGDESIENVLTDGTSTFYVLEEPIVTPHKQRLAYKAWDFGTEQVIADVNTTAITAGITYEFNARDTIRGNKTRLDVLEPIVAGKIDKVADDYYPQLAVGLADNLSGVDVVDSEVNFRRSGGGAISDGVARLEAIKGNSVVWNQLVNLQSATGGEYSNGKFIITNATERNANLASLKIAKSNANHKYLLICVLSTSLETKNFAYAIGGSYPIFSSGEAKFITSNTNNDIYLYPFGTAGVVPAGATSTIDSFVIHDLTQMFGAGNEPTTIEEFYARIPMGVDLNAYNEGEVIHMDVQSIESVGVNQWDEEWRNGHYGSDTGRFNGVSKAVANVNPIKILPNSTYAFNKSIEKHVEAYAFFYDDKMNFISYKSMGSGSFTSPSNAVYMNFYASEGTYGSVYNHDICINISDTSINGKYFPYIKRVEDLAVIRKYFPQGMKSAGSAHDEIRYNKASGKWEKVVRIGQVNAWELIWNYMGISESNPYGRFSTAVSGRQINKGNILCTIYTTQGASYTTDKNIFGAGSANTIIVIDSAYTDVASFTAMLQEKQVVLYYELAEPIVTELDAEDQFRDLDYQVWNCGTEKAIAEGKSAPLAADITYGFNAIGKIKELESLVAALRAKVGI